MCVVERDERWAKRLAREARLKVMGVVGRKEHQMRERTQWEEQNEEAGRTS
jgi:hypothetical protein